MMLMKRSVLLSCCIAISAMFASEITALSAPSTSELKTKISQDPYSMDPWPSEKFSVPLDLPNCPWIKIIEWRKPSQLNYGGFSEPAKKILDETCVKAVKNFSSYITYRKHKVMIDLNTFRQSLCLIPALSYYEGLEFRNLNDSNFRFRDREKTYDNQGQLNIIWGYTSFRNNTSYIRNDVINEDGTVNNKVVTVFAHELYHAMSWHYHVNDRYHNDAKIEEDMAVGFTQYLGYGK